MNEELGLSILNEALDERVAQSTSDSQKTWSGKVVRKGNDGAVYVDIFGGERNVPCSIVQVATSVGHTVQVRFQDGRAIIVGDTTDPAAPNSSVTKVDSKVKTVVRQVEIVQATKADVEQLTAAEGRIDILSAGVADIETAMIGKADVDDLTAAEARIGSLEADHVSTTDLQATNARIGTVEADYLKAADMTAEQARVGTLLAGKADVSDLTAATGRITTLESENVSVKGRLTAAEGNITTLNSTKANIADIEANYIDADTIEATYMHANMSNSDVAWISNGVIANGAISSAMINDVSANKLTAGTINGSVINVTNLTADNITTGTLNGQRIGAGSLSLDKLSEDVYTEAEVDAMLGTMQAEIDGAIETWTGTAVPTLNNAPASSWTTAADRDKHVGDVYFNTTSGYNYRFTKSGTGSSATYSWLQIKDTDITNALQRIQTAEGQITQFDSDISTLKTDTGELKTKTQSLETSLGDKVDTTTFNELEDTVDGHTQTISQHTTAISNKADSSTVTAVTNRVSKNEQDISGINTTIGELQTTVASKADGSTVETISSKLNTVSDTVDGHTQTISSVQGTAENANNKAVAYSATSATGASTAAKVAACTNFPALAAGVTVTVRFSAANTSTGALTLNVNSTGAKTVYVNGSATASTNQLLWAANANITFTYDGTYWRVDSEPRSWYGTCSTAAGTAAKSAVINEAVICKGTNVTLNMTSENTNASATLNITSTGAKNIYYGTTTTRPTTSNGYGWTAASTVTFVFDGAYWRLGDTSALAGLASVKSTVTEHSTSIQQNAEAIQLKANSSDVDSLTGRVSTAESTITQHSSAIEAKVSKDGVIAAINLSTEQSGGSAVKISADKVNIEGATIFTSGRLSQTSLDGAYDAAGSASAAQSAAISAAASDATAKADAAQAAATSAANAATDSKLESYSTTEQMNAALDDKVNNGDLESYRTEVSSTFDELGEGVDGKLAELASDLSSDMEGKLGEAEDRINEDLDSVRGDISDHAESIENLEGSISLLDTYVKIDPSVPSVTIAAGDSQTVITQSALQLLFQEMIAAYIAADADNGGASTLFATQLRVTGSMRFGNWEWYERPNHNMSVRWVGEET